MGLPHNLGLLDRHMRALVTRGWWGKVTFKEMEMNDCFDLSFPLGSCKNLLASIWWKKITFNF